MKAVGATYMTLKRWAEAGGGAKRTKRKVAKKTRAVAASARLTLIMPDGLRIKADDPKDMVAVLNALR
jgi:hypothetical protein